MSRSFILSSPLLALLLTAASGCAGDDTSTTADTETGGTDTDTGDTGQLGDEASQACRDAMLAWPAVIAATDAPAAEAAYVGSALQDYLRASDPEGARGDDAAILAAIADGSAPRPRWRRPAREGRPRRSPAPRDRRPRDARRRSLRRLG
jgi:hypothetical protein